MRNEVKLEINKNDNTIRVIWGWKEIEPIVCKDKEELKKMFEILLTKNDLEILDWCRGWCNFLELGNEEDNRIIRERELI